MRYAGYVTANENLSGAQFQENRRSMTYAHYPQAETGEEFRGQMRGYRAANSAHQGVEMYHARMENGFMAHVGGLIHQAKAIDAGGSGFMHSGTNEPTFIYQNKLADLSSNSKYTARDDYVDDLRHDIARGTSDPIHVAHGYEMENDKSAHYGHVAADNPNEAWIGNGHHRLVLAHSSGIERIPARGHAYNTGDDYGDDGMYDYEDYLNEHVYGSGSSSSSGSSAAPKPQTPSGGDYAAWRAHKEEHSNVWKANSWQHGGNAVNTHGLYTDLHGRNQNISPAQFGGVPEGQQMLPGMFNRFGQGFEGGNA